MPGVSEETRKRVVGLRAAGLSYRAIGIKAGLALCSVVRALEGTHPPGRDKGKKRASFVKGRKWRWQEVSKPDRIWYEARRSDKRCRGLPLPDLTKADVIDLISGGCSYCGETNGQITLDRKDNAKGHARSNVVAACYRCNYTRRNMPYAAWNVLAPAMRSARELGLFGDWLPWTHGRGTKP